MTGNLQHGKGLGVQRNTAPPVSQGIDELAQIIHDLSKILDYLKVTYHLK